MAALVVEKLCSKLVENAGCGHQLIVALECSELELPSRDQMPLVLRVSVLSGDLQRRMRQVAVLLVEVILAELEFARPDHEAVPWIASPLPR